MKANLLKISLVILLAFGTSCKTSSPPNSSAQKEPSRIGRFFKKQTDIVKKLPEAYAIAQDVSEAGRSASAYAEEALAKLESGRDDITESEFEDAKKKIETTYSKTKRKADQTLNHMILVIGGKTNYNEVTLRFYQDSVNQGLKDLKVLSKNPYEPTATGILTLVASIEVIGKAIEIVKKIVNVVKEEKERATKVLKDATWPTWKEIALEE